MTTFDQFDFCPPLYKSLEKLGFEKPTEIQSHVIPQIQSGRDIIASAKTGSGKTAAFMLPILNRFLQEQQPGTRGLILLPTRELAIQTQKVFEQFAMFTPLKSGLIIGGEAYKHQVASLRKNPEIIIATPGRLIDHIEKGNVDFSELEFYVLDEADRMLDMGFAEAMETITEACNTSRQTLLFSATLSHKGFKQILSHLDNPQRVSLDHRTQNHSNITQQFILADDERHKESLITALIEEEQAERTVVFCNTRAQAQKLSNLLRAKKLRAQYLHGEVSQNDRKQVLNRFRDGSLQVLVATDLAARGLDIENVTLVINFTPPHSGDEYIHRIGRTGRADNQGVAVTLVDHKDWNRMSSIERYLKVRFSPRKIKGMEAQYQGPKKLKKSGKAAGSKHKNKKSSRATMKPNRVSDGNRPLMKKK